MNMGVVVVMKGEAREGSSVRLLLTLTGVSAAVALVARLTIHRLCEKSFARVSTSHDRARDVRVLVATTVRGPVEIFPHFDGYRKTWTLGS